jgi:hypothetical protein
MIPRAPSIRALSARLLPVLAAAALASCLDALPPDGRAMCAPPPDRCPSDFYCAVDNTCWHLGRAPDLAFDLSVALCNPQNEGATCGAIPDACHDAPTCKGSVCTPNPKPDNTVCADLGTPCKNLGRCTAGVCSTPTNVADGTPCTTPTNKCHAAAMCTGGVCGAEPVLPDGYQYDTSDYKFRCCGGQPASLDQSPNCGACGINCNGFACTAGGPMQYWCACSGANSDCWSKCCTTLGHICSPSDCQSTASCVGCPTGSVCVPDMTSHYYCHY